MNKKIINYSKFLPAAVEKDIALKASATSG
jgi:hypothetical protein